MADPVVQFFIEKLSSLLEQKAILLSGVREEAENLMNELQRMNAFLQVSETKTESDPQLKVWVDQVRDVAYDTEDLLDKFNIRLTHRHGNGLCGNLRRICFRLKNLKARHQIASEIQRLKSQIVCIAEGNQRYKDSNLPQQSSTTTSNWQYIGNRPKAEDHYVGIDTPKRQLVSRLVDGDSARTKLKCISLVGMGGCGKTTLAQQVYEDSWVKQHFDSHVWLAVSKHFIFKELLVMLIIKLYQEIKQPAPAGLKAMDVHCLGSTIDDFLARRRYVIVIDDVWEVDDWQVLFEAFPENNRGSRLMLTTRLNDVARISAFKTEGYSYHVKPLSPEATWDLFCKTAFGDAYCPQHLEDICQRILRKCDHLPLAIVTIAGVLRNKDHGKIVDWEMFHRSLPSELEGNKRINGLLSRSYDDLDHYLKICYLYMYMFPEDHEIKRTRLIRLWIAEDFVEKREGMIAEEVADRYLEELVNRSLIQVAEIDHRGRPKILRIHDVLREVLLSKAKHDIVTISSTAGSNSSWPDKVRRLAYHGSEDNSQETNRYFNCLRSLIILRDPSSLTKSKLLAIISSCKLLKVLDLRGVESDVVPNEIFDLVHLRCLSLRGTRLTNLSKKIGKLRYLEMLDLKATNITELPDEIVGLRHLRHLLVYSYVESSFYRPFHSVKACKFPSNIGGLVSLQKLCVIDASSNTIVKELGSLRQLRRLGVAKLRKEDGNALCTSLANLTNLRSLRISSLNEEEMLDLDSLSSAPDLPYNLQTLELFGHLPKAPCWINSLQNLVTINLRWSKLSEEPLNFLHNLPILARLSLWHAYEGEELLFKSGGFQRLKRLTLGCLKELRSIRVEKQSMPELEELFIGDCESMDELPFGIQHLTKLQELFILDMPVVTRLKEERREHRDYSKIQHIPRVTFGFAKDGRRKVYRL